MSVGEDLLFEVLYESADDFDKFITAVFSSGSFSNALTSLFVDILLNYRRLAIVPSTISRNHMVNYISKFHERFPKDMTFELLLKSLVEEILEFKGIEVDTFNKNCDNEFSWEMCSRQSLVDRNNGSDINVLLTEACISLNNSNYVSATQILLCIALNHTFNEKPDELDVTFFFQAVHFLNQIEEIRKDSRLRWELTLINYARSIN